MSNEDFERDPETTSNAVDESDELMDALGESDEADALSDGEETETATVDFEGTDFLPDDVAELLADSDDAETEESSLAAAALDEDPDTSLTEGSELEAFESAEIEDVEFLEFDRVVSILESILFATDRPQSLATIKQAFKGTNVKTKDLKRAIDQLTISYAGGDRGITLEEINGGYQLRTKVDNMNFLRHMVKSRTFKLSGPALEVLSIVAYKQPCTKSEVDEIRGVESGHLLRGLMERGLITFGGKSDLPGKPMLYETTRKFLEIFGLRNIKELPSLSEIDELIPEGIGEVEEKKTTLDELTEAMSQQVGTSYSEGEEELVKITDQLTDISTTTEFFEQEKQREKDRRDAARARDIREALIVGEEVSARDRKWLERYDAELAAREQAARNPAPVEAPVPVGEDLAVAAAEFEPVDVAHLEQVAADGPEVVPASPVPEDESAELLASASFSGVELDQLEAHVRAFDEESDDEGPVGSA